MNFIIDDELLDKIKSQVDIVDLISEYVPLKKSGSNYMGLCPFHNEKTPSFSVSANKGIFKCFGCGAGGDHISFIMKKENLSFREAVKFLADKYNIVLQEYTENSYNENKKLKDRIYQANKEAAIFYMQALNKSKAAYEYLSKRDVDRKTILKFGLGYAPDDWDLLYKSLSKKGYTDEELEAANLVSKSKRGNYIDRFRNRIIFPILDVSKRVIAFGGRSLDSTMPKYLNSSDTIVFNKGDNLYNLNTIKEEDTDGKIVLVEGYMDVISLYKSGINYSVASLGTAFTENQAKLIKRFGEKVYICYDFDNAGVKATDRAIDILVNQNIKPKIIRLEKGMDPDDFVRKHGKLDFELEVSRAKSYLDYKILKVKDRYNLSSSEGIIGFTTEVAEILSRLKNPIERDVYVEKISNQYGIKAESISSYINLKHKDIKKDILKKQNLNKKTENINLTNNLNLKNIRFNTELQIIAYISYSKSLFEIVNKEMESFEFGNVKIRDIYELIKENYINLDLDGIDNEFLKSKGIDSEYLSKLNMVNIDISNAKKSLEELIQTIKHFNLEERREELLNKIKSLDQDNNNQNIQEINGLIEELNEVNIKLNLPS